MYYVYPARFQPLTKLHEEELIWLVNKIQENDKIIIGIIKYEPDVVEGARDLERLKRQFNVLTYWERVNQIRRFIHSKNLQDKIPYIVPLPRPSQEMKKANYYLPSQNERKMCLSKGTDAVIREAIEELDENIYDIPVEQFQPDIRIISSELICSLMILGNNRWQEMVNGQVYNQLCNIDMAGRIRRWFSEEEAREKLLKIYNNAIKPEEKSLLHNFIGNNEIPNNEQDRYLNSTAIQKSIQEWYSESISRLKDKKRMLEGYIVNSTGFTLARYEAKIELLKSTISCLELKCSEDISQNSSSVILVNGFNLLENTTKQKIETVMNNLDSSITSLNAVNENDVDGLKHVVDSYKNLVGVYNEE